MPTVRLLRVGVERILQNRDCKRHRVNTVIFLTLTH